MWTRLAHIILKYRLWLMLMLAGITAFMGYKMTQVKMSYKFAKVVPKDDIDLIYFNRFTTTFGEDGNVLAIALKDTTLFKYENFRKLRRLCKRIDTVQAVTNVVGLPNLRKLEVLHENKQFVLKDVFESVPENQEALDSVVSHVGELGMFKDQLLQLDSSSTVILVTLDSKLFNSKIRKSIIDKITNITDEFEKDTGIEVRFAGLPYVRTVVTEIVSKELIWLLIYALAILALILFLFFRSFSAVIFPCIVIGIGVVWSLGTLAIFGYEVTLLSGLIPPIIVVIGIPNCVYLLNKYHQEYDKCGNKIKALSRVIRKIGIVTLITNLTTSVGFLVLAFNDIDILREFGIVAGINILATFVSSIILIPSMFSYLPSPTPRQLKHLEFKFLGKVLNFIDHIVHNKRKTIYIITFVLVLIGSWGTWLIHTVSYMVDDIPETSKVKQDLKFFEENFKGIMPLEIIVHTKKRNPKDTTAEGELTKVPLSYDSLRPILLDTNRFLEDPRGFTRLHNLKRIEELEDYLASRSNLTQPISINTFIKAARQAYWQNDPEFYSLPTKQDKNRILRYLKNSVKYGLTDDTLKEQNFMSTFIDSTGQIRVSLKMEDIGSKHMDTLINYHIRPTADSIFSNNHLSELEKPVYISYAVTGTSPLFVKGNRFLIKNLRWSLVIAFVLISLVMGSLFGSVRMILISLVPNIIPLVITGAVMGYLGIPLKPSTALIFTIAFGISVDDSIHYLAKYRQELYHTNFDASKAVSISIRETGASMIYTSVILFSGFIMFATSDFDGTVMLGILTSTTLLIAMITNLVVLPALLLTFDAGKRTAKKNTLLIDQYSDEYYDETEDEEIDIDRLDIQQDNEKSIGSEI